MEVTVSGDAVEPQPKGLDGGRGVWMKERGLVLS